MQWTAGLWKLKICCPHPLPENQLLILTHEGGSHGRGIPTGRRSLVGRTPEGSYSPSGSSRHLLETPFSEPLLRTLLRSRSYCKTLRTQPRATGIPRTPPPLLMQGGADVWRSGMGVVFPWSWAGGGSWYSCGCRGADRDISVPVGRPRPDPLG